MKTFSNSDLLYSWQRATGAQLSTLVLTIIIVLAIFAPLIAPQDPFDPQQLDLLDSQLPPFWLDGGQSRFLLGTDDQGRDILSVILYGMRLSLLVGLASVIFSCTLGTVLGLLSGYFGNQLDMLISRIADIQLTISGVLISMLLAGVIKTMLPVNLHDTVMIYIVILAIGISDWPKYARVTRSITLVQIEEDYVYAAKSMGLPTAIVLFKHVLPNILRPSLVMFFTGLAIAIMLEATLSFLGAGIPVTTPSLGTLIRTGTNYLFAGEWWIVVFPGLALLVIVFSLNSFGDWLRDATNKHREGGL